MDVHAGNRNDGEIGGESFDVNLPGAPSVERITTDRVEFFQVEVIDTTTDIPGHR